jgi:hypothetical protein
MSEWRTTPPTFGEPSWSLEGVSHTTFDWGYGGGREKLLSLYDRAKTRQWNSDERLDWNIEVDKDNPLGISDADSPMAQTKFWSRLSTKQQGELRLHLDAWRLSQLLHGEQGALIASSKIVQAVPELDSKFYAATQVYDEARHLEVFTRYLTEKLGIVYPASKGMKTLLEHAVNCNDWDFTYLAMQVILEGIALAGFGNIRDTANEPLAKTMTAYVMQDEARHVAFGRLALADYYPHLSQAERDRREEFAVEACYLMRDRFVAFDVFTHLGIKVTEVWDRDMAQWEGMKAFRRLAFSRIVPALKDIGLFGPKIQKCFMDMGVLDYADLKLEELGQKDEDVALELDRLREKQRSYVDGMVSSEAAATSTPL